jgi:hypothetical protein
MLVAPRNERLQAFLARFHMSLAMHREIGHG